MCFLDVESELKNSGHAFDENRKAASRSRALPSRKTMSVSMFIYMCRIFTTNPLLVFYRFFFLVCNGSHTNLLFGDLGRAPSPRLTPQSPPLAPARNEFPANPPRLRMPPPPSAPPQPRASALAPVPPRPSLRLHLAPPRSASGLGPRSASGLGLAPPPPRSEPPRRSAGPRQRFAHRAPWPCTCTRARTARVST